MRESTFITLFCVLCILPGCRTEPESAAVETKKPPEGVFLYQPQFHFQNGKTTNQGTGFFVQAPGDRILAVTSAHFLDFDGPKMMLAEWISIPEGNVSAEFAHSFGKPGDGGTSEPYDLRRDYLILVPKSPVQEEALWLDERIKPNVGEKVWFPDKTWDLPSGLVWVSGYVEESEAVFSVVVLDRPIELQSQSGSPIISQETGKVIGTLARGGSENGVTRLILCPSRGIADAIAAEPEPIPLQEAVGK